MATLFWNIIYCGVPSLCWINPREQGKLVINAVQHFGRKIIIKVSFYYQTVNLKETFMTWIQINFFSLRIQDPDPH